MRLVSFLAVLALAACASAPEPLPVQEAPPPPVLDFPAQFEGTLPCGDCAGIETRLILLDPGHYVLWQRELRTRTESRPRVERGSWSQEGMRIRLGRGQLFALEGIDRLFPLDAAGGPIARGLDYGLRRDTPPVLVSGQVRREPQGLVIDPCGVGAPLALIDYSPNLGELVGAGAYADFIGSIVGNSVLAWGVERIGAGSCDELLPEILAAEGNGWSLEVDRRSIRLRREGEEPLGAPWSPFRWEDGAWRYWAETGSFRLEVVARPGLCTRAGLVTGNQVEVRLGGETFEGCGHFGPGWQGIDG